MAFPGTANRVADLPRGTYQGKQKPPGPRLTTNQTFHPGQRSPNRGGGGPANIGAHTEREGGKIWANTEQPSWAWEFSDQWVGVASPSSQANVSGTRPNNFRELGDYFGGRG